MKIHKSFCGILSAVMALTIALGTVSSAFGATKNVISTGSKRSVIIGDTDYDGEISVMDAAKIQKYLVGKATMGNTALTLADVNGDNSVDVMDSALIQKYLVNLNCVSNIGEKVVNNIKFYFSDSKGWNTVYYYMYNSVTGEENKTYPGVAMTSYEYNDLGEKVFSATADVNKYDRIIFSNGSTQKTIDTSLNMATSGFYPISGSTKSTFYTGVYGYSNSDTGKTVTTTLQYSTGYNKKIWIWTPKGYSATSAKKYKTVYIMDGQNLFDDNSDGYGGWRVNGTVEALMENGGEGVILVGIDNGNSKRDSELTPDIGAVKSQYQSEFSSRTGKAFSDFVVNTVMPYVQKDYNSSTLAQDNCIAGSSSGGLEAFYIGMENMDKFGNIGALSPAFALFSESVWNSYLSKLGITSKNVPNLYIYNGNGDSTEKELYSGTCLMYNKLLSKGYEESKIRLSLIDDACHNEAYWRAIFPEMLTWCYEL
jgi:predicted alpha/beta superfamily hydrolase